MHAEGAFGGLFQTFYLSHTTNTKVSRFPLSTDKANLSQGCQNSTEGYDMLGLEFKTLKALQALISVYENTVFTADAEEPARVTQRGI